MKKLKPALSVLGSVSMALTLASPALADVKQPNPGSTVEIFKENANAKKKIRISRSDRWGNRFAHYTKH